MSPLTSLQGTGGYRSDTAVSQYQNFVTHPSTIKKGEVLVTSTGTSEWTVPDGVTWISVVCIGGGGAGKDAVTPPPSDPEYYPGYKATGAGGGGAGLAYSRKVMVKPGDVWELHVGAGGISGAPGGGTGGDTWIKDKSFGGEIFCKAESGQGGYIRYDGNNDTEDGGEGGRGGIQLGVDGGYGVIGGGNGGDGGPSGHPHESDIVFAPGGGGGGTGGWGAAGSGEGAPSYGLGPGGDGAGVSYMNMEGGSPEWTYVDGEDGAEGAGGGGSKGSSGGGTGLYGPGTDGEGGDASSGSYGEGGSPAAVITAAAYAAGDGLGTVIDDHGGGEDGSTAEEGNFGSGGGGGSTSPDSPEGEPGGDGAIRIVYGCGVSFPDNAKGKYY